MHYLHTYMYVLELKNKIAISILVMIYLQDRDFEYMRHNSKAIVGSEGPSNPRRLSFSVDHQNQELFEKLLLFRELLSFFLW